MQKDPIGFAGGDTNLYRYVGNDFVNKVDPSGQLAFVAAFVAYETGFFIGAIYNAVTTDMSIIDTYASGYSVFSNFAEQVVPSSSLFMKPETYKVIDGVVNKRREKQIDELVEEQCPQ